MVSKLFCWCLWRSATRSDSKVYRTARFSEILRGAIHLGLKRPSFLASVDKGYLRMSLESAEINEGEIEVEDEPFLTKQRTLKGRLCFDFIDAVMVNGKPYPEPLRMQDDWGDILHLEMAEGFFKLFISWERVLDHPEHYSEIVIHALSLIWENDPTLFDPYA